jgi:hypothetical protein
MRLLPAPPFSEWEPFRLSGCNPAVVKPTGSDVWCDSTGSHHFDSTDVADKQGSGLQNRPMQEHYLPSVPIFPGNVV